jgi:prepilin-type N-terminal cleavage/methylation domain-containing protein
MVGRFGLKKKKMKRNSKQSGFTLIEMMVVIAIVALLVSVSMPALRQLVNSTATEGTVRGMIGAAMASARAIAAREQRYAGIRFQQDLDGRQYMIFIVQDSALPGLANGFRAVGKLTPIELPDTIGVMNLMVRINHSVSWQGAVDPDDRPIIIDDFDDTILGNFVNGKNINITDMTTFSIVFSPSGKLVIHNVKVRNKDGFYQPDNGGSKKSMDDVFNSLINITQYGFGMFIQDDYAEWGLGQEPSRRSFVIYDKTLLSRMSAAERFDYLRRLERIHINPYTGTLISTR